MLELVKAYEIAKGEQNKFLRYVYIKYTKYKLKKSFFNKFDFKLTANEDLLNEFIGMYKCINDHVNINKSYPYVEDINFSNEIHISYCYFSIYLSYIHSNFKINIVDHGNNNSNLTIQLDENEFNKSSYKAILIIAIYNYCVSYIYGYKSKLYVHDKSHMYDLKNLYI